MRILLDEYSMFESQIALAEKRLHELFDSELSRRLQTFPGVGAAIVATIIAEIGDIHRFSDVDQRCRPMRACTPGSRARAERARIPKPVGR